ncbi:hypothetical protein [Streptomyces sp. B21-101]|uniref:hypothetical protein n=1 Tax=Streptomyces sp. B21-101 TaxID=3039415 RepID=UPI002FF3A7F9
MTEPDLLRTCSLIAASALRGDDKGVELLLNTLHPDHVRVVAIAAVTSMADLVTAVCGAEAVQAAIRPAQDLAHQAATEGNTR